MEKTLFGKLDDGSPVFLYSLKNNSGMKVNIINYGAIVTHVFAPDKNGRFEDVVLGYDTLKGYINDKVFLGAIVGRYGNRIAKGKFSIDGKEYQLAKNNGENHLHGGPKGFFKVLWNAEPIKKGSIESLKLKYISRDGEEGYPGTVELTVTYTLTETNELKIDYEGKTDKPTVLNPTNHSYFNLSGDFSKTILDHELQINAETITPVDQYSITTGDFKNVGGTPFDFRKLTPVGLHINDKDEQLKYGNGYDHNWVLNSFNKKVREIALLYHPNTGRYMEVLSDQPGVQFYSGNFLDGSFIGKNGLRYQKRSALCLETQYFPDSPNKQHFPSATLRPSEVYRQTTIYKFSVK
ncbi:MAG TPA: aldose epimerase family protein [Ignavibacteriaceae bacterium]|nr:aldose epimerase family protein [Ignavibacteriaceae bacterium]